MTTRLGSGAADLLALLPPIRRARLWRLYAADGRRFLDLWQDGGRGILGAKGEGLGRVAKAEIDLGRCSPLPSVWQARLESALRAWKPGYAASRVFLSEERALAALAALAAPTALELPLGEYLATPFDPSPIVLAVLPCPAWLCPAALLFRDDPGPAALPASDLVAPAAAAIACRSLAELARFSARHSEDGWRRADRRISGLFERRGPWLIPRYPAYRHGDVFRACLAAGILISPDWARPSILPGEFDDGEIAPLSEMDFV
jgi:hypothetical protein